MATKTEKEKMLSGELYFAFVPELVAARRRAFHACNRYNNAGEVSRRRLVELWRDITQDARPLPPRAASEEDDERLFEDEPWIEAPLWSDYGFNLHIGSNTFIGNRSTFLDVCPVTIGSNTLVGPSVNFYGGTHPLDGKLRNGIKGPELGKPISVGEDCWIGGNSTILPGVTIGNGGVVGAGSVVTRVRFRGPHWPVLS
ncbi:MAG: hypothetical protein M1835_007559 [Candelina submexicana]|nr:MAG: hypothetical protein M1835_007559 [Candelina submexicana]